MTSGLLGPGPGPTGPGPGDDPGLGQVWSWRIRPDNVAPVDQDIMAHQVLEVMEHLTRLGETFTMEEEELEELVQVQGVMVEEMVEAVEEEVEVWSKVAELAEELWSTGMGLGDASTTSTISILLVILLCLVVVVLLLTTCLCSLYRRRRSTSLSTSSGEDGLVSSSSSISSSPRSWSSWSIESKEEGGFLSWNPRLEMAGHACVV